MPQRKSNKKKETTIKNFTCASCGTLKDATEFYASYSSIHTTGKIPYCKDCLRSMILDDRGQISTDKFKDTLKLINRPYLHDLWLSSIDDKMDTFGCYMKNLGLVQNRKLTWEDSKFSAESINQNNLINNTIKISSFELSDEIIDKWGAGYKVEEYQAFERKYNLLKNNYPEKTAMHTEALLNYIRYRVKEELATASGDVKDAKDWGALAKDAATAAKINPSQLSKADLTEGLSTFGELVRAVEQSVDIIPILPRFKEKPQDKADFTIWCYINYVRDLKGLPPCDYKAVYQFYEERKKEYAKHSNKEDDIFENEDENGEE
jgi:hypothetical protein